MKTAVLLVLRLALLTVLYFILFAVFSALLIPRTTPELTATEQGNALLALLTVSVVNTCALTYIILRSRLWGWKLVLSVFVFFFGTATVMPQIETAVFVTQLPSGMLTRIIWSGFLLAAVFSSIAVVIVGKHRQRESGERTAPLKLSLTRWMLRLMLIGLLYVIIYFTFGYFIAWKSPAVRAYYHGVDPGTFISQLGTVLHDTPWLFLLQFVRGVLWALIAWPVIRMMKGGRWEQGLAIAVCFAVWTSLQLLIPNPLMPYEVRMAHLLETSTSNFLFGLVIVLITTARQQ
jgi:hypothetical protein